MRSARAESSPVRALVLAMVGMLLLATVGCGSDTNDDAEPVDSGTSDQLDGGVADVAFGDMSDSGNEVRDMSGDMSSTVKIEVDLEDLKSCREICGENGLQCAEREIAPFGPVGPGAATWGEDSGAFVECDDVPDETMEDIFSGETLELTSFSCYCSE